MIINMHQVTAEEKSDKESRKRNNWDMFADEAPGKAEVNVSFYLKYFFRVSVMQ